MLTASNYILQNPDQETVVRLSSADMGAIQQMSLGLERIFNRRNHLGLTEYDGALLAAKAADDYQRQTRPDVIADPAAFAPTLDGDEPLFI